MKKNFVISLTLSLVLVVIASQAITNSVLAQNNRANSKATGAGATGDSHATAGANNAEAANAGTAPTNTGTTRATGAASTQAKPGSVPDTTRPLQH